MAIADYESAIRLDPNSPWGYAFLASIYSAGRRAEGPGRQRRPLSSRARQPRPGGDQGDASLCEVRAAAHEAAGESDLASERRTKARQAASQAPTGGERRGARPQSPARAGAAACRSLRRRSVAVRRAPDREARRRARPGRGTPRIGHLSSIPSDYRGSPAGPLGLAGRSGGASHRFARGQAAEHRRRGLQQAMQRNQAERELERSKQELDNSLQRMFQANQELLLRQQQGLQQP